MTQASLHALLKSAPSDIVNISSVGRSRGVCGGHGLLRGQGRARRLHARPRGGAQAGQHPGHRDLPGLGRDRFFRPVPAHARPAADAADRGRRAVAVVRADLPAQRAARRGRRSGPAGRLRVDPAGSAPAIIFAMPSILLVDDSGLFRGAGRGGPEAHRLRDADGSNGTEALDIARREKPQMIVVKAGISPMTGYDLCRVLKADPAFARTPIAIVGPAGLARTPRAAPAPTSRSRCRSTRRRSSARSGGSCSRAPRGGPLGRRVVDHVLARRHAAQRHDPRPVARRLLRPHDGAPAHRRAHRRVVRRPGRARRQDRRRRGHRRAPRARATTAASAAASSSSRRRRAQNLEECLRILALGRRSG